MAVTLIRILTTEDTEDTETGKEGLRISHPNSF